MNTEIKNQTSNSNADYWLSRTKQDPKSKFGVDPKCVDANKLVLDIYRFGKYPVLTPDLESIRLNLSYLVNLSHWVCFKVKWAKNTPLISFFNPRSGKVCQIRYPQTWGTFDEAVDMFIRFSDEFAGIAFALPTPTAENRVTFSSGSAARNTNKSESLNNLNLLSLEMSKPGTTELKLYEKLQTYCEVSPLGNSLQLLGFGFLENEGTLVNNLEFTSHSKFIPITGLVPKTFSSEEILENTYTKNSKFQLSDIHVLANKLHKHLFGISETKPEIKPIELKVDVKSKRIIGLSDNVVLENLFNSSIGLKASKLWNNDLSQFDGTIADAIKETVDNLLFYCGSDIEQVDRLFKQSELLVPRWDEIKGNSTNGKSFIQQRYDARADNNFYSGTTEDYTKLVEARAIISRIQDMLDSSPEEIFSDRVISALALIKFERPSEWFDVKKLLKGRIQEVELAIKRSKTLNYLKVSKSSEIEYYKTEQILGDIFPEFSLHLEKSSEFSFRKPEISIESTELIIPVPYRLTFESVLKISVDKSNVSEKSVCSVPVVITGRYRAKSDGSIKLRLSWMRNGTWNSIVANRSTVFQRSTLVKLGDKGLPVTGINSKMLLEYLSAFEQRNLEKLNNIVVNESELFDENDDAKAWIFIVSIIKQFTTRFKDRGLKDNRGNELRPKGGWLGRFPTNIIGIGRPKLMKYGYPWVAFFPDQLRNILFEGGFNPDVVIGGWHKKGYLRVLHNNINKYHTNVSIDGAQYQMIVLKAESIEGVPKELLMEFNEV
jgi:hypothetical protein